ncbi:MAG: HepT-like ribonuclease domain-containing protein [Caulobacteraceae bacterium]
MPSEQPRRRLEDILAAIGVIRNYVSEAGGLEAIAAKGLYRDAVERQLLIIAEAASKLRGQVEALAPEIDWNAIRGMGNVIRHDYDQVDEDIVRLVVKDELAPLEAACRRVLAGFRA